MAARTLVRALELCVCVLRYIACQRQYVRCGYGIKQFYFVTVSETDPPGTDLSFRVEAKDSGDYWKLNLTEKISPLRLRTLFVSSFQFQPGNKSESLICRHTSVATYCDLKVVKMLDAERIWQLFGTLLPTYAIEFSMTCVSREFRQPTETFLHVTVEMKNEFSPKFSSPSVTVSFSRKDLTEGSQIFNLYNQVIDKDVGQDGQLTYDSVGGGGGLISFSDTKVFLARTLREKDFTDKTLKVILTAKDHGEPARSASMTLVVRLKTETDPNIRKHNQTDNKDDGGTSDDDDTSTGAQISRSTIVLGLGIPLALIAVATALCIVYMHYRKPKRRKEATKVNEEFRQPLGPEGLTQYGPPFRNEVLMQNHPPLRNEMLIQTGQPLRYEVRIQNRPPLMPQALPQNRPEPRRVVDLSEMSMSQLQSSTDASDFSTRDQEMPADGSDAGGSDIWSESEVVSDNQSIVTASSV
ncbi:hypothetical protein ACOMHN_032434 [Nucella lapillus]